MCARGSSRTSTSDVSLPTGGGGHKPYSCFRWLNLDAIGTASPQAGRRASTSASGGQTAVAPSRRRSGTAIAGCLRRAAQLPGRWSRTRPVMLVLCPSLLRHSRPYGTPAVLGAVLCTGADPSPERAMSSHRAPNAGATLRIGAIYSRALVGSGAPYSLDEDFNWTRRPVRFRFVRLDSDPRLYKWQRH